MGDADWEQESDYARYVLRGPTYEQLLDKADEDRKRAKEEGPPSYRARDANEWFAARWGEDEPPQDRLGENPHYGPGNPDWERDFEKTREDE